MNRYTEEELSVRARLREVIAEGEALRARHDSFDEPMFRSHAMAMATGSRDQGLHDAVWDYREGAITRQELQAHPTYERMHGVAVEQVREQLSVPGGLEAVHKIAADAEPLPSEAGGTEAFAKGVPGLLSGGAASSRADSYPWRNTH